MITKQSTICNAMARLNLNGLVSGMRAAIPMALGVAS